jgi:hypothetical protein
MILNGCWVQMADAMTGWFGLDIAGDDGYKFGRWQWQTTRRMIHRDTGIEGAPPAQPPAEPPKKVEPEAKEAGAKAPKAEKE